MSAKGRALLFLGVPAACAVAALAYRQWLLQRVRSAQVCALPVRGWRCESHAILISGPAWVLGGLLIGVWLAYGLVRLATKPTNLTKTEAAAVFVVLAGLVVWIVSLGPLFQWMAGAPRWDELLLFLLAAVLVRLAIVIASTIDFRGRLLVALGLPVACAGLGYGFVALLWRPNPPTGSALAAQAVTWAALGALVGSWLAFTVAKVFTKKSDDVWVGLEAAVVGPLLLGVVFWTVIFSSHLLEGGPGGISASLLLFVAIVAGCAARIGLGVLLASRARGLIRERSAPSSHRPMAG